MLGFCRAQGMGEPEGSETLKLQSLREAGRDHNEDRESSADRWRAIERNPQGEWRGQRRSRSISGSTPGGRERTAGNRKAKSLLRLFFQRSRITASVSNTGQVKAAEKTKHSNVCVTSFKTATCCLMSTDFNQPPGTLQTLHLIAPGARHSPSRFPAGITT